MPYHNVYHIMHVMYIRDHGDFGVSGQKNHPKIKPASQYHPGALAVLVRWYNQVQKVPSVK